MINNTYYGTKVDNKSGSRLLARSLGYLLLGLGITTAVAIGISLLFNYLTVVNQENADAMANIEMAYLVMMIGSVILLFILSLVLNFTILRSRGKPNIVPYILYTMCVGVLFSTFTLFVDWWIVASALGLTLLTFGVITVIAILVKDHLKPLYIGLIGIGTSLFFMMIFYFVTALVFPGLVEPLYILISAAALLYMCIITTVDIAELVNASKYGDTDDSIALHFAYRIYVDFVYIFIRILYIILRYSKRN